jgi:catalase
LPREETSPTSNQPDPQSERGKPARLAAIAGVLVCVAGAFLYLGGWFSPNQLTQARFVNGFQKVFGFWSGFRRNHAKGVCVTGFFESNGQGARLSKAVVFQTGRVPVIGRFSLGGGDPYQADAPNTVRGLGLQFRLSDGEEWRTSMINLPVFPFNTAQAFYDNLLASQPDPATHKPDPQKQAAFAASHPEFVQAARIIQGNKVSSGFDNSTFNGLNAFRFIDAAGTSTPVRWTMAPVQPFAPLSATAAPEGNKNYLFDGLIASTHQHPLQWQLIITIGQPGDPTNDATLPWPDGREHVVVGTLTLDTVESEETSPTRVINFDPLVLPAGIAPSDDPLLSPRSAIYSQSFTRRAGEKVLPSAITPSDVRK